VTAAFTVVVVLSAAVGASATLGYATDLQRSVTAAEAGDRVTGTVTNLTAVTDGDSRLLLTVRVENPSAHDLTLAGTYVQLSNATVTSLATGAASFEGEAPPVTLRAGETRTVRYAVSVRNETARGVRAAQAAGPVTVSLSLSLHLRDESVTGRVSDTVGGSD
jgi:hypothetical protein